MTPGKKNNSGSYSSEKQNHTSILLKNWNPTKITVLIINVIMQKLSLPRYITSENIPYLETSIPDNSGY